MFLAHSTRHKYIYILLVYIRHTCICLKTAYTCVQLFCKKKGDTNLMQIFTSIFCRTSTALLCNLSLTFSAPYVLTCFFRHIVAHIKFPLTKLTFKRLLNIFISIACISLKFFFHMQNIFLHTFMPKCDLVW